MRMRSALGFWIGLALVGPAGAVEISSTCPPTDRLCIKGQLEMAARDNGISAKIDLALFLLDERQAPDSWQRGATLLQQAAATGDSWSTTLLAGLYRDGKGLPADGQKVIALLVPLAIAGNAGALSGLGDLFARGSGSIAADTHRAIRYYERAAAAGDRHGQYQLAIALLTGKGAPADVSRAISLLEQLAAGGDPWILIDLADVYVTGKAAPAERAVDYLDRAVSTGNSASMVRLAQLYQSGIGSVPPDLGKAHDLLEQAADLGQPGGQVMLARMLLEENEDTATARALDLLDLAASTGDAWGSTVLADLLIRGDRVAVDGARAMALLTPLAEQGNAAAFAGLGNLYATGAGTIASDPTKAVAYYEKAAALDDFGAKSRLALMLVNGDGILPDTRRGLALLEDVAAIGDGWAKIQLGDVLLAGNTIPIDPAGAIAAYEAALEDGLAAGAIKLGNLYLSGAGDLAPDPIRAAAYFSEAAAGGESVGKINLALLLLDGKGVAPDVDRAVDLLTQVASTGGAWANAILGGLYADGRYLPPDYQQARTYSIAAQRAGDQSAMLRLGMLLATGPLAKERLQEGIALVDDSVAAKQPGALVERARLAVMGVTGKANAIAALRDLSAEVDAGNPAALRLLLQLYRAGARGVEPDPIKGQALLDAHGSLLTPQARAFETIALRAAAPSTPRSLAIIGTALENLAGSDLSQAMQILFWSNKNAYVYVLQHELREMGLYVGPLDGLLTRRTIAATNRACDQLKSRQICAQGPLTPTVAVFLSDYFASRNSPVEAKATESQS